MPEPRPETGVTESAAASRDDGINLGPDGLLFDLAGLDLNARIVGQAGIESKIPHRGQMLLFDAVVWRHPTLLRGVGYRKVREDEFWVPGHFPKRAVMPGVIMVESAAQLACYLFMTRHEGERLVLLLRLEHGVFRNSVSPGDDFYLLCDEVKVGRRQFKCDLQGLANGKPTFEIRVSGMMV